MGSKAWSCDRSHAGNSASNPEGGMDGLMSVVCCHVEVSARADHSFRRGPTECGVSECDLETSDCET